MKMLNPNAAEWAPTAFGAATVMGTKSSTYTSCAASSKNAAAAGQLAILTSTQLHPDADSGLATPNGLAELASVLSGAASADMTFEDLMFDNSSRRASLVGALDDVEEEHTDDIQAGDSAEEPPTPAAAAAAVCAAAIAASAVNGCDSDGDSSNRSDGSAVPLRSMPVPITQRKVDDAEVAAVAKAQQDLLADASNLTCASSTDTTLPKLGPHDFDILRVVGQGAFGKVFQVRARATGRVYAMKVMRKERILLKDHGDYVRAERDLLTAVVHPYIVTMRYSFQTASKLYLVLDFINGGHLFFNLYREGVFAEDVARLYTAEIVAALSYLHERGIVHRDLKPENVLLDVDGHIRITDFGLAKGNMEGDSRTNSFIGTMEYMAPEIIDGTGHGHAVDWWSTGILLFEMLSGVPPFRAKSRNQLQQQILTAKPKYPKFLSSNALSLLKALLIRDPSQRLGSGAAGAAAIKRHPFFKSIDWKKLEARELTSKFKPGVKSNLSVENFDKIWTEQRPVDSPCGTPTDPAAASAFAGFTYVAPSFVTSSMAALALKQQQ